MKKILFLSAALSAVLFCACNGGKVNYSINVSGADDGTSVVLVDKLSGDTVGSGEIEDGALLFSGKADKDALMYVQKGEDEWQTIFFADGKDIAINLEDNSVKGSELNEKLNACDKEAGDLYSEIMEAIAEYSELSEEEQLVSADEINAKIAGIGDMYKRILEENRDNIIPAAFIAEIAQVLEEEEQADLFDTKYPYARHPYTLKIKKEVEDFNALMAEANSVKDGLIGKKFIDIEEPDTEGNMHKLSEFVGQGKWVFIDFWASWCGPCRREMPNVVEAYKKYHDKGLEIVGLSFDNDKEAWIKAIDELQMPWIHLSDLKGWETVASDTYGVKSIPASLLVDPDGIVVARDLRGEALGAKLAEVLGE